MIPLKKPLKQSVAAGSVEGLTLRAPSQANMRLVIQGLAWCTSGRDKTVRAVRTRLLMKSADDSWEEIAIRTSESYKESTSERALVVLYGPEACSSSTPYKRGYTNDRSYTSPLAEQGERYHCVHQCRVLATGWDSLKGAYAIK